MSDTDTPALDPSEHDKAFRLRRTANWIPLGITYALLYTARYNFTVANVSIACERGWGIGEIARIASVGLGIYGISTFLNGPLADRIGGRRAILISAFGAALCSLIFPAIAATAPLYVLLILWGCNNYFQSFGALSVVKVNAAWFHVRERGAFSGIFGTMIQSGRWIILSLGGFLLAAVGWRSLYYLPGAILLVAFAVNYFVVRDSPELANLPRLDTGDESAAERDVVVTLKFVLRKIFTSRVAWIIAGANFCTGFVRHGIEQYWRVFFTNVYHLNTQSLPYQLVANAGFIAGVLGAMTAGVVSDRYFGSRRGPVASIWYGGQVVILIIFAALVPAIRLEEQRRSVNCHVTAGSHGGTLLAVMLSVTAIFVVVNFFVANTKGGRRLVWFGAQVAAIIALGLAWPRLGAMFAATSPAALATLMIVLLQFFIGGAHGLLAGTASMDYGGRKAAATAAGFFDGVQYLAGSAVSLLVGAILAKYGWRGWIPAITPFAVVGAILMAILWRSLPSGAQKSSH